MIRLTLHLYGVPVIRTEWARDAKWLQSRKDGWREVYGRGVLITEESK